MTRGKATAARAAAEAPAAVPGQVTHEPGPDGVTSIVLVDDHAIVRQGLRAILEREPDIEVVGEAASAAQALDLVAAGRPHIVLLDLKLSAGSDVAGLTTTAVKSEDGKFWIINGNKKWITNGHFAD